MSIELKQQLKLTQQLVMTPQLQMAIKLLQLSHIELLDKISQEIEENPALEAETGISAEESEITGEERPREEKKSEEELSIGETNIDDFDWKNYLDEYQTPGKVTYETEHKEAPQYESFISKEKSLTDHLQWQFLMSTPTETEKEIGSFIIGNIDSDGYLEISLDEIRESGQWDMEDVERVLSRIQTFDPVGVGARDLKECLKIQLDFLKIENPFVLKIVDRHLENVQKRNFKAIAKDLNIDMEQVVEAVNVIKSLDPKPGQQFTDEQPQYIQPDVYIYKYEDDYLITLNDDGLPRLRINQFFQTDSLKNGKFSPETKEYMQEKIRSASWLIKSIHQRQKTIYKVTESILKFQRHFFEMGIAHLKPMVLKDVAQDIDMHESTISRVTANKYAYTPQGIFELKYFFNSSINRLEGEAIASASVQEKIRQIIESENPKKPYSDKKITELLKESNIDIARRTVAKYREMLRILPSGKRKQF